MLTYYHLPPRLSAQPALRRRWWTAALVACAMATPGGAQEAAQELVDFNRDIRPIFSHNCYHCHGPDDETRKADLRFDLPGGQGERRSADGLAVIAPGQPAESELYRRLSTEDDAERMPPA